MYGTNVDNDRSNNYPQNDTQPNNIPHSSDFKAFGGQGVTIGGQLDEPFNRT